MSVTRLPSSGEDLPGLGDLADLVSRLDHLLRPARAALLADHGCVPGAPVDRSIDADGRRTGAASSSATASEQVVLCTPATPSDADAARQARPDVWVADLEDGFVPRWSAQVRAHRTLSDWVGTDSADAAAPAPALVLRPRALHLDQPEVDDVGAPLDAVACPGAIGPIVDVVLHVGLCGLTLLRQGRRPRIFVPKIGCVDDARWWDRLLGAVEEGLGMPEGSIGVGVLVETVPCVLDLDAVLDVFGDRVDTIAAGRWDYVGSWLQEFGGRRGGVLPDLGALTMTTPMLRRFTEAVLAGATRHGLHALGGPVGDLALGRDGAVSDNMTTRAQARVMRDKRREAREGFDGTWVSHPSHVAVARQAFASLTPEESARAMRRPHTEQDAGLDAAALSQSPGLVGQPSLSGLRDAVHQCVDYLSAWLSGEGRTLTRGRVEDLGTIEVLRHQLWGWFRHEVRLAEGPQLTASLLERIVQEEAVKVRRPVSASGWADRVDLAAHVLVDAVTAPESPEHLSGILVPLLGERPGGRPAQATGAA